MISLEQYRARFDEEPGYLDFASRAPVGATVRDEDQAMMVLLGNSRFGTLATLDEQDARVRESVSSLIGMPADQICFQPNASQGLMHVMFGLTGEVALSLAEFPSSTFAATRAADSLHALTPRWLSTDLGRVTPGNLRDQLTDSITAVAVSLVDFRTGYLLDLEGIRDVIGDRLLIVDAVQGLGVVEAPWEVADVIVAGGHKWLRAGFGTGFLALSERAIGSLVPVLSGWSATDADGTPVDAVPAPARGALAFSISSPDPVAQARLAVALEDLKQVGVAVVNEAVSGRVQQVIDLADEFHVPVTSSRPVAERAGLVTLHPEHHQLTPLVAALHNHGVTATMRDGTVRLSPHATTTDETIGMLRESLVELAAATIH